MTAYQVELKCIISTKLFEWECQTSIVSWNYDETVIIIPRWKSGNIQS